MPHVDVERLARERIADLGGDVVGEPHRAAGERPELAKDGRLLYEGGTQRDEHPVPEDLLAEDLLLVLVRVELERGIVVGLVQLHDAA